ncbi:MAG: beta-3-deoxy-D-manno-oct-2-ulosonic acid transferase [Pseudomonadota bacterium]
MPPRPAPFPPLRAPPFPWAKAAATRVARHGETSSPFDAARADAVLSRIEAEGLIGAWWQDENEAGAVMRAQLAALGPDERLRLVHREFIASVRYTDPFDGTGMDVERMLDLASLWRRQLTANRAIGRVEGMRAWKRRAMDRFLWDGGPPRPRAGARAVWPSRVAPRAGDIQIEDGFLRSRGLGVELAAPSSITLDRSGVHYDPSRPSDLEILLATAEIDDDLKRRAARLRQRIVAAGLTKYGARGSAITLPDDRPTILVPGQVEDDRSVRLGGGDIRTSAQLLAAVRAARPDAHVVFKPHPDVEAGLRTGTITAGAHDADQIAANADIVDLLAQVDEVHTLTSLAGFEALMRGVAVTTYGVPFYAGWGLTTDRGAVPSRRGRLLDLDELVAVALILYPRYMDPVTELPCPPEILVARLAADGPSTPSVVAMLRRGQGRAHRMLQRFR